MSSITVNRRVLQKLIPIAIGYLALGIACGILAQQAGLTPLEALGMSVLVFAGSGQFIGIAMMAQGAALVSIGLTIFIVNLRHLLFSSTLMNFFNGRSKNFLIGYAHGITDETFAVNLNAFETETDPRWTCEEALGLNITSCAVWSLSNALGCYAAAYLNPPTELVSYLLIAMFLGIWVNYLTDRKMIITGLVSGLLAILLSQIVPYKLHIVLATLAASGAACYITERHAGGAPFFAAGRQTCTTLVQNLAHLCADSYFRRAGPARRLSARRQPGSGTEQPVPVVDRHHLPAGL